MKIKPPQMTTFVGKHRVPLKRQSAAIVVRFKDGPYAFWTAVFKKRVGKRWRVFGRAHVGLSAGDRFDRMKRECRAAYIPKEDRPEYKRMWENMGRGANIKYVRASTKAEVRRWMKVHPVQRSQRA